MRTAVDVHGAGPRGLLWTRLAPLSSRKPPAGSSQAASTREPPAAAALPHPLQRAG
jgi:hypothetical protein